MNASTAFNIFARAVVRERKIPFEICASTSVSLEDGRSAFNALRHSAEQNNLQDLSLNDINTEIHSFGTSYVSQTPFTDKKNA